jgi:hypothetical protein
VTKTKALKIADQTHARLTALVGQLTAETCKMKTYKDAINDLLLRPANLPKELIKETQDFIENNKQLGFVTLDEFIKDAIRFRIQYLKTIQKKQTDVELAK